MRRFTSAREAKEFLISRIVEEAQREDIPLSETERKMLYFSETGWSLPDIMEVNDEFDREYDQTKYEKKIAHLIRNEVKRLRKDSSEDLAAWISAARKLKKEDHYISVMVDAAGVPTGSVSDKWKGGVSLLILVSTIIGFTLLSQYLGLSMPGRDRNFGSYTINEPLSNLLGYLVASLLILYFCVLVYAHFDEKRRLYKLCDRLIDPVFEAIFKLFRVDQKN